MIEKRWRPEATGSPSCFTQVRWWIDVLLSGPSSYVVPVNASLPLGNRVGVASWSCGLVLSGDTRVREPKRPDRPYAPSHPAGLLQPMWHDRVMDATIFSGRDTLIKLSG